MASTSPRHPRTGRFVPDAHSTGRAIVAKHVKAAATERPKGIRFADWRSRVSHNKCYCIRSASLLNHHEAGATKAARIRRAGNWAGVGTDRAIETQSGNRNFRNGGVAGFGCEGTLQK